MDQAKLERLKQLSPLAIEYFDILFEMQQELNDRVMYKDMIQPVANMAAITEQGEDDPITIARVTYWAGAYAKALIHEVVEFSGCFPWKWWSKNRSIDKQNVPVELADMLHFYISMCLVTGVKPSQLFSAYQQKMVINHQRQNQGYDDRNKTEADNQSIKV